MTIYFKSKEEFEAYQPAIKKDNQRYCIMPLRYFGKCWQCPAFQTPKGKVCDSALVIESEMQQQANLEQEVIMLKERLKTT
jgi:hypothetical protein